jgi:DNA-binding transcriptional LysR family regulator
MKSWNRAGKLRIGSSISIGACLLPEYIRKFSKRYPEAETKVSIASSDVIEEMVLENKLDLALIEGNVHSEKIMKKKFLDDELIPICGRFHEFASREGEIAFDEIKTQKFLLREPNSGTRELVDAAFAMRGFHVKPVWESTSTAALLNGVIAVIGISILPKRMLERQIRHHQVVPFLIEGIDFKRQYSVIYHENKYITMLMKGFFEVVFGGECKICGGEK